MAAQRGRLPIAGDALAFSRPASAEHRRLRRAADLILTAIVILTVTVALRHLLWRFGVLRRRPRPRTVVRSGYGGEVPRGRTV
ncbi:hypothetical protein ACQPYK_11500 [Streptosporangium sp. CA-135522]|uniref:hypothetical protein n=1 Tax=Streptosporangium sp. CA-135522 TaxID=3240072 RepID=UPI003D8AC277